MCVGYFKTFLGALGLALCVPISPGATFGHLEHSRYLWDPIPFSILSSSPACKSSSMYRQHCVTIFLDLFSPLHTHLAFRRILDRHCRKARAAPFSRNLQTFPGVHSSLRYQFHNAFDFWKFAMFIGVAGGDEMRPRGDVSERWIIW